MDLRRLCEDRLEEEAQRLITGGQPSCTYCTQVRQVKSSDGGRILATLVEILLNGTQSDLKRYVAGNLKLPLGIQHRICLVLAATIKTNPLMNSELMDNTLNLTSTARKLLLQWKSGTVSQTQYFALINNCKYHNTITAQTADMLVNNALSYGGFGRSKFESSETLGRRLSVDLSLCSLSEVNHYYADCDSDLSLYSFSGAAITLKSCSNRWEVNDIASQYTCGTPCVSTNQVCWSHEGGGTSGLILAHTMNHEDELNGATTLLRIVIGDTVTLTDGTLDVDQVISVDAMPMQGNGSADITSVAFLVEGRLFNTVERTGNSCGVSYDGATELGGNERHANDSDGSDSEGGAAAACVVQIQKQFWIISAEVHRGIVKILKAVAVHEVVFKDQVPFQVLCVSRDLVFINGTNGLLASIVRQGLILLPIDNTAHGFGSTGAQQSHSADATISSVSYCRSRSFLCSGDSNGVVCLWSIQSESGRGVLIAQPIQIEQNGKICRVCLSPSGAHVAVALWDRLILLVVSKAVNKVPAMEYCLYVRSNLDVTMNSFAAKYAVVFEQQHIRVWRVINKPRELPDQSKGLRVTTWFHPNLDSLEARCGLLSTGTAPSSSIASSTSEEIGINNDLHRSISLHTPSLDTARDTEPMEVDASSAIENAPEITGAGAVSHVLIENEPVPLYRSTFINLSGSHSSACGYGTTASRFVSRIKSLHFLNACNDSTTAMVVDSEPPVASPAVTLSEIYRPLRAAQQKEDNQRFLTLASEVFVHDRSDKFLRVRALLLVYCACFQPPTLGLLSAALDISIKDAVSLINSPLSDLLTPVLGDGSEVVRLRAGAAGINKWFASTCHLRMNRDFWMDVSAGHNTLCALYLRHCGNKSVAMEHPWQEYLRTFGACHLRRSSRGLRGLTSQIRKIDETANIKHSLPHQMGYITGLQEIYARRVGLGGIIPTELGELTHLRVLSMGNNRLCGELPASLGELRHLQRIVLHQNNLQGAVPPSLGTLGCIVNLAGNNRLEHGPDVPAAEREALCDLFHSTRGPKWNNKSLWCSHQPVANWYKVGVLSSHVHSIVMSSNGMEGKLPPSIGNLSHLRMIELATMPGLVSNIPKELCNLVTLRRLCICRCSLNGKIPFEIGQLVGLEELQLFGNQLVGSIPPSVGNLVNLKLLSFGEYTGGNSFTPAPLPSCLSLLVNLEALFMANCNLKGSLPDWIGNLKELRQLDLQRNGFTGTLPPSIGQLQNLLYLNIKDNEQLSGKLPIQELMSLVKLNRLSLVHCNFIESESDVEILRNHLPRCKIWI